MNKILTYHLQRLQIQQSHRTHNPTLRGESEIPLVLHSNNLQVATKHRTLSCPIRIHDRNNPEKKSSITFPNDNNMIKTILLNKFHITYTSRRISSFEI